MKKAYVNPEIEIVKIQTQQMMITESVSTHEVEDGFKQYSRRGNFFDDEEEEY